MNDTNIESKRRVWWNLQGRRVKISMRLADADKKRILLAAYDAIYAELRDKDARQQQAVTWAMGILLGGGLLAAALTKILSFHWLLALPLAALVALLAWTMDRIIIILAQERMSLARQLDRLHEIWRAFDKGVYYPESSLFDPVWRGWGFDPTRDANFQLGGKFRVVIWLSCVLAVTLAFAGAL